MEGKRRYLSVLKVSRMGIESGLAEVERSGEEGQRPKLSEAEILTGALDVVSPLLLQLVSIARSLV